MNPVQQLNLFESEYKDIFNYSFNPFGNLKQKKLFIGDRNNDTCRFCGKSKPDITFKNRSHIIPAAFGNRTLFSKLECDKCNGNPGSVYENDFVNAFTVDRVMTRMRSRKGHIKYSKPGYKSSVENNPANNLVAFKKYTDEDQFCSIKEIDSNTIEVTTEVPS